MDLAKRGDEIFIQFDLSGVTQQIVAATLNLYWVMNEGTGITADLVAYPLAAPWQEGIGNSGVVGGTGWPWGPASVGDTSFRFKFGIRCWLGQHRTGVQSLLVFLIP